MLSRIINLFNNVFWSLLKWGGIVVFIYFVVANVTFRFRHPWATDMEKLIHVGDALMFNKISYKEMRGEYEK